MSLVDKKRTRELFIMKSRTFLIYEIQGFEFNAFATSIAP